MKKILFILLFSPLFANAQLVRTTPSGVNPLTESTYVNVTGDTMSGPLTLAGSSLTVTGNAFSVGGSTLVVTGGRTAIGHAPYDSDFEIFNATPTGSGHLRISNNKNTSDFAITNASSLDANYLQLGGLEYGVGSQRLIGFGYNNSQGATRRYAPAYLGYVETDVAWRGDFVFQLRTNTSVGTAPSEKMRIKSNGNVGIATTNPNTKLHISSGTLTMDGSGSPAGGYALCLDATSKQMGHCSSVVAADGTCTCTVP